MNPWNLENYEDLEISTQIVLKEALNRGLKIEVLHRTEHFFRLHGKEKSVIIKEASKTDLDSYMSFLVMENKTVSKKLLSEQNLPVPRGLMFEKEDDAIAEIDNIRNRSSFSPLTGKIVVKPETTNFGLGITILDIDAEVGSYSTAIHHAFSLSPSVLIEEFIEGPEYRFLVLDYKTEAVCNRVPANVCGNGRDTIEQLVAEKNKDPRRQKGHISPLEIIDIEDTEIQVLKQQDLNPKSIPEDGQVVFLRKNSNISTGGDSVDVTDEIHPAFFSLAEKAAQIVNARICGVDIIIKDIKSPPENNCAILELNFNPVLYIHQYPYNGKGKDIGAKILDLLGFESIKA